MVFALSVDGFKSEADMFPARSVLKYLSIGDSKSANGFYEAYEGLLKEYDAELAASVMNTPLMNFVGFLLRLVERDGKELFLVLREKYAKALERDGSFDKLLDYIGEEYFGIAVPQGGGGMGGLFGGLMNEMFSG
eukprot:TRINITY_DN3422_c0_g1_i1.p2 TRINITY_DN3422_c0_g1~~TRINITY_DN3422_c0_g1_i1.p2  ORF type:complete len:135 (+),score=42.98 TRINITY_DN3422_c0_g1_i1:424-828(+)